MARKSRRANVVQEKKEELQVFASIITQKQLATAAYARLSVEKENDESIQTQIELLHQYIQDHEEYKLVDTYVDDGYTGTDFDRPEFIRLMDDVRTGKIQAIIVKDLSRFGRNFIETGYYIETIFPCLNVRLISINDEFDSSRAEDRNSMVMPIKNMINEMYAKDASKKRVLSFEMHSQRGDMKIAKSIYGYYVDKEKNQLKVNLETAPIVQAIFRWYQMGKGTGDIVKRLKMLDIMTPFAYKATHEIEMEIPETDRWTGDRIKTILLNQSYIGSTVYGKRKAAKYRNMPEHHTDPSEWIIHENTHEAIVAEPDFEEVQERWEKRSDFMKESFRRGRSRWAGVEDSFPQKVKCMECGTTMTYMRYTNFGQSQGVRKGFYYCKEYDGKPGYCRQKVHEDLLKITVMDQIHHMIKVMCDKKEVLEKMKAELEKEIKGICQVYGTSYEADIRIHGGSVKNAPELLNGVKKSVADVLGKENVYIIEEDNLGGENFAEYSCRVPAVYMFIGIKPEEKEAIPGLHSPEYQFDDTVLAGAAAAFANIAIHGCMGELKEN